MRREKPGVLPAAVGSLFSKATPTTHQTLELANVHTLGDRLQEREKTGDAHDDIGEKRPGSQE